MQCKVKFSVSLIFIGTIVTILFATSTALAAEDQGFKPIFDGKTLEGWDGNPKLWRVEDGAIVGETTKENPTTGNTFLIWRGGKPADFELKAEFRLPNEGFGNSGIQIRSWEEKEKWRVSGYQADMDSDNTYTGICYGENFHGILANRGEKTVVGKSHKPKVVEKFAENDELAKSIKKRDWNEYHIVVQGNRITQKINGRLMSEVTGEDDMVRKDGIIALQLHAGEPMKVQFKNIRLKDLEKDLEKGTDPEKGTSLIFEPANKRLPYFRFFSRGRGCKSGCQIGK
jgi:hypothetical protein